MKIKGVASVGSASPSEKNGISAIELRETFAPLWVKLRPLGTDIANQGCFNGWREPDQFFFSSVTAFVGDICLIGIFCFPVPACRHGEDLAQPGSALAQDHEDQAISLGRGMARHPVEIGVHALLDLLG